MHFLYIPVFLYRDAPPRSNLSYQENVLQMIKKCPLLV